MATAMRRVEGGTQWRVSEDMRVSELICANGRDWNQEVLHRLFVDEVSDKIKRIRPAGLHSEDTYSWEFTKTGHYTVKSAYWVQMNVLAVDNTTREVLQPSFDGIYQQIWSTEISPKVKHFMWRSLSKSLPVAENMAHRHITKDRRCSRCGADSESTNHLLFQCPYARRLWAEANIHIPPPGHWSDSLYSNLHWVLNLKKEYPKEEMEGDLAPWLLWRIWKNRNDFIFRGRVYPFTATVEKAKEDGEEWRRRVEVKNREVKAPAPALPEKKWYPPAPTGFKCNIDGSWKKETGGGGVGWVMRDHLGNLVWAGAKKLAEVGSVLETEAEALRWAAQTLAGFGYEHVSFETDSLVLKQMICGEEETWPRMKPIIQDIRTILSSKGGYEVGYYPRSGNKAANRIAKETATFTSIVPKLYSIVPGWLSLCIEADKPFVEL